MSWEGIRGQDHVVAQFRRAVAQGSLASTFLFVGPGGVGKHTFALKLAQTMLCERSPARALAPCGACPGCVQVLKRTHPDLLLVAKPADKSTIPLELLIGPEERRMREGLCHDIALRPFMGGYKVAIIDDADDFNVEGANALLKTLEEPPPKSLIVLVGTSAEKQLPTIRSRSQFVRFRELSESDVAELALELGMVADRDAARRIAAYSDGSLRQAQELCDPELWTFRGELLRALSARRFDSRGLLTLVAGFVDAAGREAPPRRMRSRRAAAFAVELFRQVVRRESGMPAGSDPELETAVAALAEHGFGTDQAMLAVERCLVTIAHVDRNVNQAAYLESWVDDLAQIRAGRLATSTRLGMSS